MISPAAWKKAVLMQKTKRHSEPYIYSIYRIRCFKSIQAVKSRTNDLPVAIASSSRSSNPKTLRQRNKIELTSWARLCNFSFFSLL